MFPLLKKKKESLSFKPTYLRSSLKAPTESKVSNIIPKSFSSRISYSYVHFLHMALLPLSASSHLHNFSSEEWLLFFTLLIRNLYFLQFSRQSLSLIKIPMTVLAYTFGQHLSALGSGWLHHFQMCAGCKTGRLWFLLSYMPPRFVLLSALIFWVISFI